ncbi:MAG: T9SS type A sorting domain-containing protein [Saprospiraceae bacterium]|nr:T9SS type A sorting domain-containing protein [Saprospiraceae bacterium]
MKIRLLTLLFALAAPMLVFGQTISGTGGPTSPAGTTSGVVEYTATATGIAGSTLAGGVCTNTGVTIADLAVPPVLGYNTEITNITLFDVQHTWASDLDLRLISPNGVILTFNLDNGGSTGLDVASDMCFDLTAANCADSWTSSTSAAQPENCLQFETSENNCGPLETPFNFVCGTNTAIFDGAEVNGTWTLEVTDDAGGDLGSFASFSITFGPLAAIPTEDAMGVPVDLLACCVDICELTGQVDWTVALEAGECEEAVFYEAPGIGGGPSCKFCSEGGPEISTALTADTEETLDADGYPEFILIPENTGNGISSYTITAVDATIITFDYEFSGSTFWDPYVITGPSGTLASGFPLSGTITEILQTGESVVAAVNSGDAVTDNSSLELSNFEFVNAAGYPCYELQLVSGPESGDYLPAGTYPVQWQGVPNILVGTDVVADPANAIFFTQNLNVLPYSGPISNALACNDHVNISADENCTITIGADMFLEGGPYGCYDDYEVNIWIYGNEANQTGNVNGATIDFGDLLGEHTYEVTDPNTGNSCWGTFLVEDKLAPVLNCSDYTINCTEGTIDFPVVEDVSVVTIVEDVSNNGANSYSVTVPYNVTITDLNVIFSGEITGSQFGWGATITSPNGVELSLWPNGIGGCGVGIDFIADEQAMGGLTCVQFQNGEPSSVINLFTNFGFPYTPLSAVNGAMSGGTWTLNMTGDFDIFEAALQFNNGTCLLEPGVVDQDACGNTSYTFSDSEVDNGCAGSTITRTWFATDASGNTSDGCVQTITVTNIGIADILLPPALIELPCGNGTSPDDIVAYFDNPLTTDIPLGPFCNLDVIERNEGHAFGYPHYLQRGCDGGKHPQIVDNSVCNIYATYADQEIPACGVGCDGNVKVIRTWTLLDWCTNETVPYTQLIKAVDNNGPTFIVKDVTVSTDPWGCEANIDIPQPWELHDDCTDDVTYTVSGPAGVIIVGDAVNGYTALGAPKGVHTFTYTAADCCGNVTSVDASFTVVDGTPPVAVAKQNIVISLTSSGTSNTGLAKLYAESVDNGSHDGCTGVKLEVRRDEDNCDIRGNATYNADGHPQDGSPNPNSPSYDPDGGAYVKFCCDDITNSVVDVNGDGENDPGYVKVWLRVWDDGDMDGIYGTAGDNYNETWTFVKVEDKLAPAIVCPPDVTLTCDMDYTDLNMTGSANGYASCGGIGVEYNDIIINLNSCNEGFVRRRWNIVGRSDIFCDQTITLEDLDAPVNVSFSQVGDFTAANCPDMIALGQPTWVAGPCDVLGYTVETDTFRFEDGACYKLVNHWTVINWCDYEPNNPFWNGEGLWEHIQVIKVTDETKPVIDDCEDKMFAINDHSDSDGDGVVCEAKITLTNSAMDPGSDNCPTGWLKWQVFVDLWGDGTDDLEYSSFLPTFDNLFNDTNGNGIGDIYVSPTSNGETISIPLPDIAGSMSNHKVRWKVTDGCNNVTTCDYEFMVVDKKAPTPYCVSLSTAVMDMGPDGEPGVELWAEDFNVGSFDNCTAQENLLYSFSGTDYVPNRTFTCDDVANSPVEVQMYVWDEKGNNDFCTVFLTIVDNQGLCPDGSKPDVAGDIATAIGTPVNDVEVTLEANIVEYPKAAMTNDAGHYAFNNNVTSMDYEITASKDVDYLNGVSTLDLVKIQRHILGLESLDSPYKLIAADVNADDQVKASDLTQLRKLILGVITDLPTNTSWRFVDGAQALNMDSDLADVDYVVNINNLQTDQMTNDMVAVKVGDVTDNAVASLANETIEVRSNKVITLSIAEQAVVAGETVEVAFTSEDFANVFGYQFTMELNGLEFAGVQSGVVTMADGNVGVLSNNIVTVSYSNTEARTAGNAEAVFTATFVATQNGNLSNMIDVTSKVTPAEAYVGQSLEIRDVVIETRDANITTEATELFQNEPNPFRTQTVVGFNLAEAASATITVFDVTGKVIVRNTINGVKGYNTVNFNANELGTSGVLYYTLESGEFTATKKMIIIE